MGFRQGIKRVRGVFVNSCSMDCRVDSAFENVSRVIFEETVGPSREPKYPLIKEYTLNHNIKAPIF